VTTPRPLTADDARAFAECIAGGGVAVFPADTVYGLAAAPDDAAAVARLYALKGRAPAKPTALMCFDRDRALALLPPQGPRTRAALEALLPGGVTLLLPPDPDVGPGPGPGRGAGAGAAVGIRVPRLTTALAALAAVPLVVTQSSANVAGGADPRTVQEIPEAIRERADLVLDAGPLPGTPSTVIDLRGYEETGRWRIVREGAVQPAAVAAALA
jgi:L-threonylcarbamoyladenylate synthase